MNINEILDLLRGIYLTTGISNMTWQYPVMWCISFLFLYLAIVKNFEPLLLLPIGFGIFIVNFPLVPLMGFTEGHGQLLQIFYHYGLEWEIIPCVIFLGLGAMTDFGPLIANPKTLLIGAGAQLGVFVTFTGTILAGFTLKEAASVGIIGGADGPTYHLPDTASCTPASRSQCLGCLFLYGNGSINSATHNAAPNHRKGKKNTHETTQECLKN